jgi:pantothenate kinase-related protein Tda10
MKDSFDFKFVRDRYRDLLQIIDDMATLTASAQIRSSGWKSASVVDELSAFGDNKQWQEPILEYAKQYKTTMQKYYTEFCEESRKKTPVKLKKKKAVK